MHLQSLNHFSELNKYLKKKRLAQIVFKEDILGTYKIRNSYNYVVHFSANPALSFNYTYIHFLSFYIKMPGVCTREELIF